jgi:hypothetical protein
MFKKLAGPLLSVMLLSGSVFAKDDAPTNQKLIDIVQKSVNSGKVFIKEHPVLAAGLLTLLLAEVRFQTRDADREPSRCDLSRLTSSDINWTDVWNVIDDGIIGQAFKSESIKVKGDKLVVSSIKLPKGILGHIHTYWGSVLEAIGVTYLVYMMERAIVNKDSEGILEYLKINNKEVATAFVAVYLGRFGSAMNS